MVPYYRINTLSVGQGGFIYTGIQYLCSVIYALVFAEQPYHLSPTSGDSLDAELQQKRKRFLDSTHDAQ